MQKKINISIINIIIIIFVCSIITYFIIDKEIGDMKGVNKVYHKIKDNDKCLDYLRKISQLPCWRLALLCTFGLLIMNIVVYYFVLSKDNFTKSDKFWILSIFLLLSSFLTIYKLLGSWLWHYLCDWGCNKTWII